MDVPIAEKHPNVRERVQQALDAGAHVIDAEDVGQLLKELREEWRTRRYFENRLIKLNAGRAPEPDTLSVIADDCRAGILADSSFVNGLRHGYMLGQGGNEAEFQRIVSATRQQINDARADLRDQIVTGGGGHG